jgi:ABC-type antimicrobial peptide transport system permease subunit
VLKDISFGHPAEPILPMGITTWPQAYYPIALVRTKHSPAELRGLLQERIDSGDLEIAFGEIHRLEDLAARDLGPDRARMALTGIAALVVIVLSAFGFYGTQRYLVTTGRREFAILSAIGAGPARLGKLVVARSFRMALPGLVLAAILAVLAAA